MQEILTDKTETIVSTLLQIGDSVLEVSRDHVITRVWGKDDTLVIYPGLNISEIFNGHIITQSASRVDEAFRTGQGNYLKFTTDIGNYSITYNVRMLPIHPDNDFLFVVVENLSKKSDSGIVEDKWKKALDTAGDGMWDIDVETDKISFSDKWHEIFGYDAADIPTATFWGSKIHPADLVRANKVMDAYLAGEIPYYSVEVRYMCKDGSYKWILSNGVVFSRSGDGRPLRLVGTHTDINERKGAEEKHTASAQLLSKLINSLHSGIVVTDPNRTIIFANQRYCDMFGMEETPEDLLGTSIASGREKRMRLYKDQEQAAARVVTIIERREIVLNDEIDLIDGRVFSRDYLPLVLGDNDKGEIWKFQDITEKKNVDRRFDEQRKFYENILNQIPADIAVFDGQHKYLFVNYNAFRKKELREWMIGKTDEDYARYSNRPYSFVEQRFEIYDRAVKGRQKVEFIEKLIGKDGGEGHHLRILNPVFYENGSLEFLLAYGLDISELVLAQQAIKASADMFASAFDYSGIGMALISPGGKWLDVNNVICQLTGYTKDELLRLTLQDITYPDDLEMDLALVKRMLRKEISTYTLEKRYVSKDRKIVLASLTVSLVWNADDTPRFFIAQIQDITRRKELEKDIYRKNAELEATIGSLINKIGQLEELSHIIAHNLRGPAGNIKMLAEVLDLKIRGGAAASENALSKSLAVEKIVELIQEGSGSLIDSLSTLMEITDIKLNKEIPYVECNLAGIINDITTQLLSTIYEKHAVIKSDLQIESINYPKAYLENILYNFISNSLKYSLPDVPPEITISTARINDAIQISVKDNGLGIDLQKYGDRIFKLNQVFHYGFDSKGVGLYITKTQIESLGGKIEVKSREMEGSEFIVTI